MAKKRNDIVIDFKGADPVSGSGRFDRIPEGTYQLKVKTADVRQTSTDKPAVAVSLTVSKGGLKGKTIGEMFVLPRKGTKDAIFGLQRLHGFMIAAGIPRQKGKATGLSVAKALLKREVVAEVQDNDIQATEEYSARTTSAPQRYYAVKSKDGKAALKEFASRGEDDEEPEEEEEDFDEEEDEDEGEEEDEDAEEEDDEDEEEEEPPKKKSRKSKKAKKSEVEEEEEEEEEEELYDDDEDEEDEEDEEEED